MSTAAFILIVLLIIIVALALSGRIGSFSLTEALLLCIVVLIVFVLFGGI